MTTLKDEADKLKNKIEKLQSKLKSINDDIKKDCDHLFIEQKQYDDHDGWSWCEYNYYTEYRCEKCKSHLKYITCGSSIGRPPRFHEYILDYKNILLKIDEKQIERFDPKLKEFKYLSKYSNKIESMISYGLKSFIEEYGIYETTTVIESVQRK